MPILEAQELNDWDRLNNLMEGIDPSDDEEWDRFIRAFIGSLSLLFRIDKLLIEQFMRNKFQNLESPFPGYFDTYSQISEMALDIIYERLRILDSQPVPTDEIFTTTPSRQIFYSEFQASHIDLELQMIKDEVLFNDAVDNETRFDVSKEATDSVKSFIKRMFRLIPKIESILATVNEMLNIGRKLSA